MSACVIFPVMSLGDDLKAKTDAFLEEFFEKGEGLIRELIEENEHLRRQIQAMETPEGFKKDERVAKLVERIETLEGELDEIRQLAGAVSDQSGYRLRLDALED